MKIAKLTFCILVSILLVTLLTACARMPISAYFKDATVGESPSNTINLNFADDSNYEDKHYDILIKSNTPNYEVYFNEEFEEPVKIFIKDKDEWYSLTELLHQAGKVEKVDFIPFKERVSKNLIFETQKEGTITLKVVVGDKIEREDGNGYVLANQKAISTKFSKHLKEKSQQV